ncbi:biopolymer transporter ExbD [Minwuia thermotolerans]|uniref:Protein TolR n=1 Tax=Minwuia thermotolerans TaxID=2056226 RepID=A0A2M9G418_9PROT|nr:biopolymer transporter ExbD [Minwuia thermotolerans]PJK29353.1 protein TolR [Minwuia thermotolerans]PJK30462.1 protein TolR [Minwuia thermotolerans]PJK30685.1 protein TolR [Minwuia thermotolerans]
MAIQVHGGRFRRKRFTPMSEINVTPFVDVMLVLLVVFMIAAPLLSVGVPVELPRAVAPNLQGLDEPLAVTIDEEGKIYLQEKEIELGDLVPALIAITNGNQERRIFVRGDRTIAYGRVIEAMGAINAAGFTRVALVAQAPARVGE